MTTPPAQPRRVLHALDATLITVGAMVGSQRGSGSVGPWSEDESFLRE